jgi:hypothetical protein
MAVLALGSVLGLAAAHAALPEPLIRFDFTNGALANTGSITNTNLTINAPAILSPDKAGVSGLSGDYAFTNTAASGMGSSANETGRDGVATAPFTLAATNTFTITGWFNAGTTLGSAARILQKTNTSSGINLYGNNGALAVEINGKAAVSSDAVFGDTGKWVFFALTYSWSTDNSQGIVNFYVGSTAAGGIATAGTVAAASGTGALAATTSDLRIGNDPGKTRPFDGLLDDIRIYDEALDIAQLDQIRLSAAPIPEPSHVALIVGVTTLALGCAWRARTNGK